MAILNKYMDATAESGRNPVSKHQIQPEYEDDQADTGRDCRTRLARPNSEGQTWTGKYPFPCSAEHEQDWQPYPVDPYSCYICDHTYIVQRPVVVLQSDSDCSWYCLITNIWRLGLSSVLQPFALAVTCINY